MKCPFVIKVCSKCGRLLVASNMNFYKHKTGKWGLRGDCKKCRNKYHKQWFENNEEHCKEYIKKHHEDNKEHYKKYNKQHYEDNKEYYKEYKRQWKKDNPDKVFNSNNKRRYLEEEQGGGITKEQWLEMMIFFDWKCAYSGEYLGGNNENKRRTIDHIIPLNKGGENKPWNLVPMLKCYNLNKYTRDMLEWYKEQTFFSVERLQKIYEWIEYAYNKWR